MNPSELGKSSSQTYSCHTSLRQCRVCIRYNLMYSVSKNKQIEICFPTMLVLLHEKTFLSDSGVLLHCDLSNSKNNSVMAQLQMIIVY